MVLGFPSLLGSCSVEENLEPTLEWWQSRLDLDKAQLKKMVLKFPPLLGLSMEENVDPKLVFFEEELGLSPSEVRAKILSSPSRLGASLTKRYRPRREVCRGAGADTMLVLTCSNQTDEHFCERVGVPLATLRAAQENMS